MLLSAVLIGAAPAAAAGTGNSTGKPHLTLTLTRLVLSPARSSAHIGASQTYTAEGYDAAGHDLGDVTGYARFSISPDGYCTASTCTSARHGPHTVTGTVQLRKRYVSGTAILQATDPPGPAKSPHHGVKVSPRPVGPSRGLAQPAAGSADRQQAAGREPAAHLVLSPIRAFIPSGATMTYSARAYDAADNDLGDVTARTRFSISFSAAKSSFLDRPDGSCAGAVCTATRFGRHTVTGTADLGGSTISGTAALQVAPRHRQRNPGHPGPPPQLASLELHPESAVMKAGGQVSYTADGYDAAHHFLGDLTAFTIFKIAPEGSCSDNTCTATKAETHTVTGTIYLKHRQVTGTATLYVVPGTLAILHLFPNPKTIRAGKSVAYTAFGEDAYGNPLGDLTALTDFRIEPVDPRIKPPGFCAGFTCTATKVGTYTVTGTIDLTVGTPVTGTATLYVVPGTLAILDLFPNPKTIRAGGRVAYTAFGADAYGNTLGNLTAETHFSIDSPGSCAGRICTATKVGTYTVTGTISRETGDVTGTATLHVVPSTLASLMLTPPSVTASAGDPARYKAIGQDAYGNPLGNLTAATSFTVDSKISCPGGVCAVTKAGTHTVTGTISLKTGPVRGTAILRVVPGPPVTLTLIPNPETITAGGTVQYQASDQDAYGNPLDDLTAETSFSIGPDGSCALGRNECRATKAGTHTVTGTIVLTDRQVTGRATLQVVPGPLAILTLRPGRRVITPGDRVTYDSFGWDAYHNWLGEQTDRTHFWIDRNHSCAHNTCTTTQLGKHTVTGAVKVGAHTVTGIAHLLVLPLGRTGLVIRPKTARITPGGDVTYRATGKDANHTVLTAFTKFTIGPDGSCNREVCTATKLGWHTVTGTLIGTHISDTAHLQVASVRCVPSKREISDLRVTPKNAKPGTQVLITAKVKRTFASCVVIITVDGFGPPSHTRVGPGGTISVRRIVPDDAKPGIKTLTVAGNDGKVVTTASFRVLNKSTQPAWLWLLLGGALLLLALAAAAVLGDRARRQRRWVRQHVRAEPHPSPENVTAERDPQSTPTFNVRLRPYGDAGTQIFKEGD